MDATRLCCAVLLLIVSTDSSVVYNFKEGDTLDGWTHGCNWDSTPYWHVVDRQDISDQEIPDSPSGIARYLTIKPEHKECTYTPANNLGPSSVVTVTYFQGTKISAAEELSVSLSKDKKGIGESVNNGVVNGMWENITLPSPDTVIEGIMVRHALFKLQFMNQPFIFLFLIIYYSQLVL